MLKFLSALLLLGLAPLMALGQESLASLTPTQIAKIKRIEGRLMAPCCYTQTIRDHDSQVAADMRNEVIAMVGSGKSEDEIITYYRKKYGETILVVPDGLAGHLLTILPFAGFFTATIILCFYIRSSVRGGNKSIEQVVPNAADAEQISLQQRIRAEVGDF